MGLIWDSMGFYGLVNIFIFLQSTKVEHYKSKIIAR